MKYGWKEFCLDWLFGVWDGIVRLVLFVIVAAIWAVPWLACLAGLIWLIRNM